MNAQNTNDNILYSSSANSDMNMRQSTTLRNNINDLLARAPSLPLGDVARAFGTLVPTMSRFNVALEVLLPAMEGRVEPDVRFSSLSCLSLEAR
jgi:hypothetical protein